MAAGHLLHRDSHQMLMIKIASYVFHTTWMHGTSSRSSIVIVKYVKRLPLSWEIYIDYPREYQSTID